MLCRSTTSATKTSLLLCETSARVFRASFSPAIISQALRSARAWSTPTKSPARPRGSPAQTSDVTRKGVADTAGLCLRLIRAMIEPILPPHQRFTVTPPVFRGFADHRRHRLRPALLIQRHKGHVSAGGVLL